MTAWVDRTIEGFDWDAGNLAKCTRHGLSREAVESVFKGVFLQIDDSEHSAVETRFQAIGRTGDGRLAFVAFTFRSRQARTLVRPISARYMHRKEIDRYERQAPAPPVE